MRETYGSLARTSLILTAILFLSLLPPPVSAQVDRTYGYGAALHGLRVGRGIELGLVADTWKEPAARERLDRSTRGTGWNVSGEVDVPWSSRFGVAAKVGAKSAGFLPGRPSSEGAYGALGVEVRW